MLSRFVSADTIVPGAGNPQTFNRYMYVLGNPLKYTDPTGNCVDNDLNQTNGDYFNCTELELSRLNWDVRIWWLRKLGHEGWADGWFENIVGILRTFQSEDDFSDLDGWASVADAGLLWAIQDGFTAIRDTKDPSSAAGTQWANFFSASKAGADDATRRSLWGKGEIAATTYGRYYAEDVRRIPFPSGLPGAKMNEFLDIGDGYREHLASGSCNGCKYQWAYSFLEEWEQAFTVDLTSPKSPVGVSLGAQFAFTVVELDAMTVRYGIPVSERIGIR